jgi:hypothetical protein
LSILTHGAYIDPSSARPEQDIAENIKELIRQLFGKELEARCLVETIPQDELPKG